MYNKLKAIMAAVFETEVDTIDESSSPDTVDNWDSLRHIGLVTALEEEYGIRLTDEQIAEMLNFKLVVETLKESGVTDEVL